MTNAKGVVLTFGTQRKRSRAFGRTDLGQLLAPACQNFVRIGLMTHIPDNAIVWGIKNVMQSYRQFNNAQTGTKMAARLSNAINEIFTQLTTQRL